MNVMTKQISARLDQPVTAALRMLAVDAVERAKSGHPGAPMGLAEVAAVLWRQLSAPQPGKSGVARPRPFRAVERPRLDAALCLAASDRLRSADRRTQALSPAALENPRPSRIRRHAGRRDDNGAARPGLRQCGRHGDRREDACRAIQPSRSHRRRSSHLRHRRRRLHDGGHQPRSGVVGRPARSRQAHRHLRRQRHLDRRQGHGVVRRRHGETFRSLWLARGARCRRTRSDRDRCRAGGRGRRRRAAEPHLLQDRDRPRRPDQTGSSGHPRRAARRRGSRRACAPRSTGPMRRSRSPPPSPRPGTRAARAARSRPTGTSASNATRPPIPELAAEFNRRVRGELPAGFAAATDAFVTAVAAKGETIATRKASQNALAAFARELPELFGGSADLAHSNLTVHPLTQPITRDRGRQHDLLRRARVRHDGDRQRHRAARRLPALCRDLSDVLRLRAQCHAHERADAPACRARVHPRLDRSRRGRPDPPAGGARGIAPSHPQPRCLASM